MFGFGLSPPDFDSQLNNRPSVSVPDSGEVLLDNFRFRYKYPDIWTLGTWPSDQFLCLTRIQGSYSYDRRSFHWRPPMRYCHIYTLFPMPFFFWEYVGIEEFLFLHPQSSALVDRVSLCYYQVWNMNSGFIQSQPGSLKTVARCYTSKFPSRVTRGGWHQFPVTFRRDLLASSFSGQPRRLLSAREFSGQPRRLLRGAVLACLCRS